MRALRWTGEFDGPGVYLGVPMPIYRSDPCPAPSLNSSIAKLLLFQSPAHALCQHPRLSEQVELEEGEEEADKVTKAMDIGSAAHTLAFGFGPEISVIHALNWKKKCDQEAKKAARAIGETPLLAKDLRVAQAMANIARPIINDLLDGSLVSEAMIVHQDEKGFWTRGLVDRCRADLRVIIDYKTTKRIASPFEARQLVYTSLAYFQEGFYRRILDAIDPDGAGKRRFCFLYQEQEPPYTLCLVETDEAGRSVADEQVEAATNLWQRALVTGEWPGYPLGPHIASPPTWLIERWARRAESDETLNPYVDPSEWMR